jgi:hypothetical protein
MSGIKKLPMRVAQTVRARLGRGALITLTLLVFGSMAAGALAGYRAIRSRTEQTQSVTVVLSAEGFQPAEITRPAGQFTLLIESQSRSGELVLQLKRDGAREVIREIRVPEGATSWSEELELAAGGYNLRAANNPAWLFHLTVQ